MKKIFLALLIILASFFILTPFLIAQEPLPPKAFILKLHDQGWVFSPAELGIKYKAVRDHPFQKLRLSEQIDSEKMRQRLMLLAEDIKIIPQNASLEVNDGFKIRPDIPGLEVKIAELQQLIEQSALTGGEIEIPTSTVQAEISAAGLQEQLPTKLLASYTTEFVKNPDRTENIRVASSKLNNVLIGPEETFSFNQTVGERAVEKGYREAMVIINGKFVPGLAGGICQVSSTLYNALLLADLDITERWAHSLKVAYVPLGQDATVNYGVQDLKFKNNSGGYILLTNYIKGDTLTFNVYGIPQYLEGTKIVVQTKVQQVIENTVETLEDPTLPLGTTVIDSPGQKGYKSSTYMYITKNGKTEVKYLHSDYYRPLAGLIKVGTLIPESAALPGEEAGLDNTGNIPPDPL